MRKLSIYTKQGEHGFNVGPNPLNLEKGSVVTVRNVCIWWKFENVDQTNTDVVKIADDGTRTVVTFGREYWTLFQIAKRFKEEDVSLTLNAHVPHFL